MTFIGALGFLFDPRTWRRPPRGVPAAEVISLLERLANDDVFIDDGNDDGLCYDVVVDGWLLSFFNDACEVDYLAFAKAPDGRHAEFDDWWSEIKNDPLGALPDDTREKVAALVQKACERPETDPFAWTR